MNRIRMTGSYLLTLAVGIGVATPTTAQQHFPAELEIRQIAQDRVDARTATDLIIGTLELGGVGAAFSVAGDFETATGSVDRALYEIGSITKTFTGIVLADMVRKGEVSLDTPVDDLLPESVEVPTRNGRQITLLDLATHHSALPRLPTNHIPGDMGNPYADFTVEMMYDFLNGYELPRDIGSEYEYSNLAVGLLGHALALRAGMTYEELIRARVLDPLGMSETVISIAPDQADRLIQGHDAGGYQTTNWDGGAIEGAGALRSTAWDMMTFLQKNIEAARGELTTPVGLAIRDSHQFQREISESQNIGLNWMHIVSEEGDFIGHSGGTGGYRAFVGFNPEKSIGVFVLSNQAQRIDDIGAHLLTGAPLRPPASPAPLRENVELEREVLERYVGEYQVDPNRVATFTLEGLQLWTQMTGQPRLRVHALSETTFHIREVDAEVHFEVAADGTVEALVIHQGGAQLRAPRR